MFRRNVWFRALIVLTAVAVALHIGSILWDLALRFGDIIMLFTVAWILAFVLRPSARIMSKRLLVPWPVAVAFVYLLFFTTIVMIGIAILPVLVAQITELANRIPAWSQEVIPQWYETAQSYLPEEFRVENLPALFGERDFVAPLQQLVAGLLQNIIGLMTGLAVILFSLIIALILSFYLTLDGDRIHRSFISIVPREHRETVYFLTQSVEHSFGGFLRGQLIQAVIYATGTALVMWVAGVGYIVLATTIAALAMVIPFVGPFIAIVPPIFLAALAGSLTTVLFVAIALLALQQVVFNVIAPKVMSEAVGIHPLLVFLALLMGSKVAGVAGAILGVPVAAVIAAMVVFFYKRANPEAPAVARATAGEIDTRSERGTGMRGVWHRASARLRARARHKQTGG